MNNAHKNNEYLKLKELTHDELASRMYNNPSSNGLHKLIEIELNKRALDENIKTLNENINEVKKLNNLTVASLIFSITFGIINVWHC